MSNLVNQNLQFNSKAYWDKPLPLENSDLMSLDPNFWVGSFDQNGYDLTEMEQLYYVVNADEASCVRGNRFALKRDWFKQVPTPSSGAILNHCYLFERKGTHLKI
jgi:hypothetical protein